MAAGQSAIRDYLKSKGYTDDDVTYENGTVKLKNQNFINATPQADGRTYASGDDLKSAYEAYANNASTAKPNPYPGMLAPQAGERRLAAPKPMWQAQAGTGRPATDPAALRTYMGAQNQGTNTETPQAPSLDAPWDERLKYFANNQQAANDEKKRAYIAYRLKTAMGDTDGASAAKDWIGKLDTVNPQDNKTQAEILKQQYIDKLTAAPQMVDKPTGFKFDQDTLQNDPTYLAYQKLADQRIKSETNNAMVALGKRGMGSSSLADTAANQIAQKYSAQISSDLVPKLYDQKYKEYLDNVDIGLKVDQENYGRGNDYTKNLGQAFSTYHGLDNEQEAMIQKDKEARIKYAEGLRKDFQVPIRVTNDYGLMDEQVQGRVPVDREKMVMDQLWKAADASGVIPNELADMYGLPRGTQTVQAKQIAATIENQKGQLKISQQNADTNTTKSNWDMDPNNPENQRRKTEIDKAKKELDLLGKTKPITVEDAQSILLKTPFITDETTTDDYGNIRKTGKKSIDKTGLVQAIVGMGLPDEQMDALFNLNGISQADVQEVERQLRGK